jgi:hypothetical protein
MIRTKFRYATTAAALAATVFALTGCSKAQTPSIAITSTAATSSAVATAATTDPSAVLESQRTAKLPNPYQFLPKVPSFRLTSQTVKNGKPLPIDQFSGVFGVPGGKDISPQLSWFGFPKATKGFVVSMFDPEAPTMSGFWHWYVANLPATTKSLPANAGAPGSKVLPAGAFQGPFHRCGPAAQVRNPRVLHHGDRPRRRDDRPPGRHQRRTAHLHHRRPHPGSGDNRLPDPLLLTPHRQGQQPWGFPGAAGSCAVGEDPTVKTLTWPTSQTWATPVLVAAYFDMALVQPTPLQARPVKSVVVPDQARPDQARPNQARPDQARPAQARPAQARPDQARPSVRLAGRGYIWVGVAGGAQV